MTHKFKYINLTDKQMKALDKMKVDISNSEVKPICDSCKLWEYVQHRNGCRLNPIGISEKPKNEKQKCTCGLDRLLKQHKEK